jgi:hypothetical protein
MRKLARILAIVLVVAALSTAVSATGTPTWWDNPGGTYSSWTQTIATGSAQNSTLITQYVTAVMDVPNVYNAEKTKDIWAQVEWTVVTGTGVFQVSSTSHKLLWHDTEGECPVSSAVPFPDPPDGVGFMQLQGTFTPEWSYANGNELRYFNIDPQPACERIEFVFTVEPGSQIDYRIEVQTVCDGPNAVRLSDLTASAAGMGLPTMALVGVGGLALVGVGAVVIRRRRRA